MPCLRILFLPLFLLLASSSALAEGFAMQEWGARGLSLAGGMVARADDASAVAYNPAGITQLPGVHLMAGLSLISPYGQIKTPEGTYAVRPAAWFPPHMYATWQLNDDWWLGLGVFSRFGLGVQYPSTWSGRYANYNVGLQSLSANPVVAYKVNDWLSLAAGVEIMYLNIFLEKKVDLRRLGQPDNDMNLQGDSWGVGMNAAAHIRFNEQWSAGLTYRSQMTHNVQGKAKFQRQYPLPPQLSAMRDADANATVQLPDSAALAVTWKPLPNLSFEAGAIWTRWSTYNTLNVYSDKGMRSIKQTSFRDGWNFNASVEYSPLDWLALRLGYWRETPVVNTTYADYLLPTNGRDGLMAGVGFKWHNWTLDLAYAHLWIYPLNYDTATRNVEGVRPGVSKNTHTDMFSVSLGYSF
jgi:long-chain fatty acid transport protein